MQVLRADALCNQHPANFSHFVRDTETGPEGGAGSSPRFFAGFLPNTDLETFEGDARIECVMFGPGAQLRQEIKELRLGIRGGTAPFPSGTLNDLLRVRTFGLPTAPAWTELHPTAGPRRLPDRMKLHPRVVVFDGARGFLRWRNYFEDSAWIVVLDRNEPQFMEGASELNTEYAQNSIPDEPACIVSELPPGVAIPPGVEVTSYFRLTGS